MDGPSGPVGPPSSSCRSQVMHLFLIPLRADGRNRGTLGKGAPRFSQLCVPVRVCLCACPCVCARARACVCLCALTTVSCSWHPFLPPLRVGAHLGLQREPQTWWDPCSLPPGESLLCCPPGAL